MILQLSTVLLVSVLGVFAAPVFNPIRISSRDVWAPQIFEPSSDTTWVVGSTATATWDTSNPPAQITNPQGTLVLGHLNSDGSGGENLDLDNPLAQGFDLHDGSVTFDVPDVEPNNNYIVALIGDSGNISQNFTISD
ncbi:hypothetical protein BC827DRAFT_1142030 [Russula dissimulans]|nr:hypothetical protein BC827DRAFT_1142030 [Russula dissimulans]